MQTIQSSYYVQDKVQLQRMLRNTYSLLSVLLLVAAGASFLSMSLISSPMVALVFTVISFGLIFVINRTANSAAGLGFAILFAGTMGASIGPLLNFYANLPQGGDIITQAFVTTAVAFFGLSAIAMNSKRDFSFMRSFLMVGLIVVLIAIIANLFLSIPALSLTISSAVVLLMAGFMLYETNAIVRGEYTNYILAAVGLFMNVFNMFVHLLNIIYSLTSED